MTAELQAEQEVDLGRYVSRVLRRWWLVAACAAAGVLIGWLTSVGGGTVYRATATVYLGQPLSPSGGAQIQSLATNPSTVGEIVRSQEVIRAVAAQVGVEPGKLRSGISTGTVSGAVARQGQNPLVEISVRGPWREESAAAANALAGEVVTRVSGAYTETKITTLRELLDAQERELGALEQRIADLQAALEDGGLEPTDRLVASGLLSDAEQRRGQVVEDLTTTRQLLTLAENVEASRVVTEARATKVAARNRRNSIVVGGVVGLLAGIGLALALPALRPRPAG
jgi:uncharacterized protein involved in exopolysaccharide biosynthesis